jgi:hypothetical protein
MGDCYRIKPYDGQSDFAMWKVKMQVILTKERLYHAITDVWDVDVTTAEKKEVQSLAHAEIMLRLTDEVARQVVNHTEPKPLWDALET